MLSSSGAISAKAKAMYGRRIKPAQYEELIRKRSVAELTQVLKNETGFAETLKDVHEATIHRGQLEHLLRMDLYRRLDKLVRYVDGKQRQYYLAALKEFEIEQILARIRMILSKDFTLKLSDFPTVLTRYTKLDTKKLAAVQSLEELIQGLSNSPYAELLAPYINAKDDFDYTGCEAALQAYYMSYVAETIEQVFRGKCKKTLKQMWSTRTELDNITKIYRFKKFFHASEKEIRASLTECEGSIPKAKLNEMLSCSDAEAFLKLLAHSPYHLHTDDKEYVYIEYYADQIKYHLAKRHLHYDSSPAIVYTAYQLTAEREIENLINIIEGVRYQVAPEEIMTMLIYDRE